MEISRSLRHIFQLSALPMLVLFAVLLSSVFALTYNLRASAAVGDSCSYSADGKIYTGKMVDLNGVNFCDASTDQAASSSPTATSTTSNAASASPNLNCTLAASGTTMTYNCTGSSNTTTTLTCSGTVTTSSSTTCTTASTTDSATANSSSTSFTCTPTSTSQTLNCTNTATSTAAAAATKGNTTTKSCTRTGSTGTDLNSYLDACGGKQQIRVTKAKADKDEKVPAIILVHGGGWFSDDGMFSPTFQKRIAKWGFTTMRIKYRLMPGGVQEQLWDVQRAIRHVYTNAGKYGIDRNRIAVWGDSAGGSLAVRAGATGDTKAKAAVGWSAPTNAFRDLFNSYDGWLAGLYHSRCVGNQLPASTNEIIDAFIRGGLAGGLNKIASSSTLTPQQSISLLNDGLSLANTSLTALDSTGSLQKTDGGLGYTASTTDSSGTREIDTSQLKAELKNLNASELAALGVSIYQFTRSAAGISTNDATTNETISLITNAAAIVTQVQKEINQEASSTSSTTTATGSTNPNAESIATSILSSAGVGNASELVSSATKAGNAVKTAAESVGINTQIMPAQKIAECIDDFYDMSPALFAGPRSPQMFLAGAARERWVNPLDAYQMRDKLRSMGKSADALILPATNSKKVYKTNQDGHMGYDQRAEVPTLQWLHKKLKSKTDSQRAAEVAAAKKKAEAAAAKVAASQQSSTGQGTSTSTSNSGSTGCPLIDDTGGLKCENGSWVNAN